MLREPEQLAFFINLYNAATPESLERDLVRWFHDWAAERCFFLEVEGEATESVADSRPPFGS